MPSQDHEDLVKLFDHWPLLAVSLLGWCGREVPGFTEARSEKSHLTEPSAPGYQADVVIALHHHGAVVRVVVIEIQRGRDARKRFTWPLYQVALANRFECPVELIVVPLEKRVSSWVQRTIDLIRRDHREPVSVADAVVPAITDLEEAKQAPAHAVFSAVWYARRAEGSLAMRIAHTAMQASVGLEREQGPLYSALIDRRLPPPVAQQLEALMTSLGQSKRGYLGQKVYEEGLEKGVEKGVLQGERAFLTRQLTLKFGPLPSWAEARVAQASPTALQRAGERILQASTLEEVLD